MPQRANVTSVDAIRAFRTNLLVYLSKARPTLEEVSTEVMRTKLWIQNDQRTHWEGQMKRRGRQLEDAKAALFSSKMSNLREASAAEQAAVTKAQRLVHEAEEKLRMVKLWDRDFENRTDPMLKQMEKLTNSLTVDVPNAAADLAQSIKTLEEYAGMIAPGASLEPPPPSTVNAEEVSPETAGSAETGKATS
jgi:hypothetical protein